jgi:ATP-dependent Clp protease ATP-binding subunit ClpA
MFEMYTEKARRVIFFARYEASEVGSPYIESEQLLLGLMREDSATLRRYSLRLDQHELLSAIAGATFRRTPTPTSVDLPLSNECKRILAYAAEEAARLAHKHIGTENLLLGILREEGCLAARLLRERGAELNSARAQIAASAKEVAQESGIGSGSDAAFFRRHARTFRIVVKDGAKELLVCPDLSVLPRLGDAILIREEGQAPQPYLVRDAIWDFAKIGSGHHLQGVEVRVAKAEAAHGESGAQG